MKSASYFPVGIPGSWHSPEQLAIPNQCLQNWLLDTGSLTERLVAESSRFNLTLIGQQQAGISHDEFTQIRTTEARLYEQDWQVREVILFGNEQPWVFARSIIPVKLWNKDFTDLNTQPLGQRIFNDPKFMRLPFELNKMAPSNTLTEKLNVHSKHDLWGRRSTFNFEDLKMMVCEVFLPDSPAYSTYSENQNGD